MIRRHALRLVTSSSAPKPCTWPMLSAPVDVLETDTRILAQSILCGCIYRDGRTSAPPLTLAQAVDVLTWVTQHSAESAGETT